VSGYTASCPSCGAPIEFRLGASLLRVCESCGVAVARKGADLAAYGRVAALIPTPSVLKLGLEGGYSGAPRFTLVGRLQLDYGAGTWDEWLMGFDNDTWAWLSESQGKFHYMAEAPLPAVPGFERVSVGQSIDLGDAGVFVVIERREARFMTAAGELPFDVEPGSLLRYADLSGPNGAFATLDFGTGDVAEALYVGREIVPADLGLTILDEDERAVRTQAKSLSCPQCGGPIELRAPDQTQRVACSYCGSLLDATGGFAVLEALKRPGFKIAIPLGSEGRLHGVKWTVIGAMERSVTVDALRYPWREYLLYEPAHGFRWLVETNGHWSFVEPVNAGDISGQVSPRYGRTKFLHFQNGDAVVDYVVGEFYWAVARGDTVASRDFVSPPLMLSEETDAKNQEVTWSLGTYLEPRELEKAFGVSGLPWRKGIAPNQPSPWKGRAGGLWRTALLAFGAMFLVYLFLFFTSLGSVFQQTVTLGPGLVPGAPESATFTEPFVVSRRGTLQVKVQAPVNNSWLYLDGALINDETGSIDEFDVEVSYYSGSDSDGSWSEGDRSAVAYIRSVPPGRYVLRLAPQWQPGLQPSSYDVSVRSRVPRFSQLFFLSILLFFWPIRVSWRSSRFESQRWSESDHPGFGGE
jgi:hypothetical protein